MLLAIVAAMLVWFALTVPLGVFLGRALSHH
jgi:hypothetical protein